MKVRLTHRTRVEVVECHHMHVRGAAGSGVGHLEFWESDRGSTPFKGVVISGELIGWDVLSEDETRDENPPEPKVEYNAFEKVALGDQLFHKKPMGPVELQDALAEIGPLEKTYPPEPENEEGTHTPTHWEHETGIRILNADGWGRPIKDWPARGFGEKITLAEFHARANVSTCSHKDRAPKIGDVLPPAL